MPTGFRQLPNKSTKNFDDEPLEIKFFGVSGTENDKQDSNFILANDTNHNLDLDLNSGFKIEVELEYTSR